MPSARNDQRQGLAAILVGIASLYCFVSMGAVYANDWSLELGFLVLPEPSSALFSFSWLLFGGIATVAITWGATLVLAKREFSWRAVSDRSWMLATTTLALLIAVALRMTVLHGVPVVDDSSAYQFSAELLAHGKLAVSSHPEKLLFDRIFMVNDGRYYSQYFLGWPALMVPGVWLGIPGYMNAFYAALTIVPLFLVVRRSAGSFGARIAVVIYITAPMLMVGAASQMSHTTCICALTWLTYFALRSRDEGVGWGVHTGVAIAFCVAFFVRPLSTVGIGLPVLVYWAIGVFGLPASKRRWALVAFSVPAAVFGAAFLWVNLAQNGSAFTTAYAATRHYAETNGLRFTMWNADGPAVTGLSFDRGISGRFAMTGAATLRLANPLFGWPLSFVLAILAWGSSRSRLPWFCVLNFLAVHSFSRSPGVDTFGPVHYSELALPILVLSGIGVESAKTKLASSRVFHRAPAIFSIVLMALAVLFYAPPRLSAVSSVTGRVERAISAPHKAGLERAIVFAPFPFLPKCYGDTTGFVYSRPNNDPALHNRVLWVNHLTLERDEEFAAKYFSDRAARVLVWDKKCNASLLTFAQAREANVPPTNSRHINDVKSK